MGLEKKRSTLYMFLFCLDEVSMASHMSKNEVSYVMIQEPENSKPLIPKLGTELKSCVRNVTPHSHE